MHFDNPKINDVFSRALVIPPARYVKQNAYFENLVSTYVSQNPTTKRWIPTEARLTDQEIKDVVSVFVTSLNKQQHQQQVAAAALAKTTTRTKDKDVREKTKFDTAAQQIAQTKKSGNATVKKRKALLANVIDQAKETKKTVTQADKRKRLTALIAKLEMQRACYRDLGEEEEEEAFAAADDDYADIANSSASVYRMIRDLISDTDDNAQEFNAKTGEMTLYGRLLQIEQAWNIYIESLDPALALANDDLQVVRQLHSCRDKQDKQSLSASMFY